MEDHKIIIRLFNEADLITLQRMICSTIEVSYSGVYPPRAVEFFKGRHSEEKIAERSITGEVLVLVAEGDGYILATGSLEGSEIVGVFVHHDHQRQGHGKAVMAELENMARAKGILEVSLSVSLPSRVFYEQLGYELLEECAFDVGGGQYLKYWPGKKVLPS